MKLVLILPPKAPNGMWVRREQKAGGYSTTPETPYFASSIAGFIRKKLPSIRLSIIDSQINNLTHNDVATKVKEIDPDLIITLISAYNVDGDRKCSELPYPTISIFCSTSINVIEAILLFNLKTQYFVGESDCIEQTLCDAIVEFKEMHSIMLTPNTFRNEAGFTWYHQNKTQTFKPHVYEPIMPAFDLFDIPEYLVQQTELGYDKTLMISTQEGCPYTCTFCSKGLSIRSSFKTPDSVMNELEYLRSNYNCDNFILMDSEFSAQKERAQSICTKIIESNHDISWQTNDRVNLANPRTLKLMKGAGCTKIYYGIESGDPATQKITNKNLKTADIEYAFKHTKRVGIKPYAYVMVGFLGETRQSLNKTLKVLQKIRPYAISCTILFPSPCSAFYYELKNKNLLTTMNWSLYRDPDELSFIHDTYKSLGEIKKAQRWMINRSRIISPRGMIVDPALIKLKSMIFKHKRSHAKK